MRTTSVHLLFGALLAAGCGGAAKSADSVDNVGNNNGKNDGQNEAPRRTVPGTPEQVCVSGVDPAIAAGLFEIHALDIWSQPLPASDIYLDVKRGDTSLNCDSGGQITNVFVDNVPGKYTVHLEAPMHDPVDVHLNWDGTTMTFADQGDLGAGLALGQLTRTVSGVSTPTNALYIGLRHKWFSATARPARRGNTFTFMMDGEEAWKNVRQSLLGAKRQAHISTWWWESDFELKRSISIGASQAERWPNTIMGTLESNPSIDRRVLVGTWWGQDSILSSFTSDSKLHAYADQDNDKFEVMGQANETKGQFQFWVKTASFVERVKNAFTDAPSEFDGKPIISTVPPHDVDLAQLPFDISIEAASYHQKFMLIDDDTSYIGGMNLRHVDWDTSAHQVFDWRRMKFDSSDSNREYVSVKQRATDTGPRKDYMVRIEGPASQDVADVFKERWDFLKSTNVSNSQYATTFPVERNIDARANGIQVQVTTTLPQPFDEHGIAETWFNAINHAEEYIYIEDQYFRIPMLLEAIKSRMDSNPNLKLIVITMPIGTWGEDCFWTAKMHETLATNYGTSRYTLMHLRSWDSETNTFADMDTHSKLLMVDDTFLSIGSANKNNRGIVYEAEMNAAIADRPTVTAIRKRILQNLLQSDPEQNLPDNVEDWYPLLTSQAAKNELFVLQGSPKGKHPQGFVFNLASSIPHSAACEFQSIGPDDF